MKEKCQLRMSLEILALTMQESQEPFMEVAEKKEENHKSHER